LSVASVLRRVPVLGPAQIANLPTGRVVGERKWPGAAATCVTTG
jgi:hypothetical protein